MAAVQTPPEIHSILTRIHGQEIGVLEVLGPNSLKAVRAAGLAGVNPHDLRASHASWLIDDG